MDRVDGWEDVCVWYGHGRQEEMSLHVNFVSLL